MFLAVFFLAHSLLFRRESMKIILWSCLFFFGVSGHAENAIMEAMLKQQRIMAGKTGFQNRCAGCHGPLGDGAGETSQMLNPRPRNLLNGSFKFRSTPSGVLPTLEDLIRTINQGVLGTAMPSFKDVSEEEKSAIALYLQTLRPDFKETKADQIPLALPPPPFEIFAKKATLIAAAKKGKLHYQKACINCHGESGVGDGPAAPELTDSDNIPIRPANLRLPFVKGGKTPRDVFRAISTGLDGSPMPGFDSLFKENERWELVAFIYYLRGLEAGIYKEEDKL